MEECELKFRNAYYVGTHRNSFRSGEAAIIKSVQIFISTIGEIVCFHVEYGDGVTDFCPVSDTDNYKLLTDKEIKFQYRPSV